MHLPSKINQMEVDIPHMDPMGNSVPAVHFPGRIELEREHEDVICSTNSSPTCSPPKKSSVDSTFDKNVPPKKTSRPSKEGCPLEYPYYNNNLYTEKKTIQTIVDVDFQAYITSSSLQKRRKTSSTKQKKKTPINGVSWFPSQVVGTI